MGLINKDSMNSWVEIVRISLLEENRKEKLLDISLGREVLHLTLNTKINKWDYTKK